MHPSPERWMVTAPVLLAFFVGGGLAGACLARALAPDSELAQLIGMFALPIGLFFGLILWLGTASVIALTRRVAQAGKRLEGPRAEYEWGTTVIPPGSRAFVVTSIVPSLAVGVLVGLLSATSGVTLCAVAYVGMGAAYGVLCWKAAANGYLPFPVE